LRIKVFGGNSHGKTDYLTGPTAVLGRVEGCDFIVEDALLTKKHCSFNFDEKK
jgi:hypothetical protein